MTNYLISHWRKKQRERMKETERKNSLRYVRFSMVAFDVCAAIGQDVLIAHILHPDARACDQSFRSRYINLAYPKEVAAISEFVQPCSRRR